MIGHWRYSEVLQKVSKQIHDIQFLKRFHLNINCKNNSYMQYSDFRIQSEKSKPFP